MNYDSVVTSAFIAWHEYYPFNKLQLGPGKTTALEGIWTEIYTVGGSYGLLVMGSYFCCCLRLLRRGYRDICSLLSIFVGQRKREYL